MRKRNSQFCSQSPGRTTHHPKGTRSTAKAPGACNQSGKRSAAISHPTDCLLGSTGAFEHVPMSKGVAAECLQGASPTRWVDSVHRALVSIGPTLAEPFVHVEVGDVGRVASRQKGQKPEGAMLLSVPCVVPCLAAGRRMALRAPPPAPEVSVTVHG